VRHLPKFLGSFYV